MSDPTQALLRDAWYARNDVYMDESWLHRTFGIDRFRDGRER